MKLPALAMAASFAAGIAPGQWGPSSQTATTLSRLRAEAALAALLLAAASGRLRLRNLAFPGFAFALPPGVSLIFGPQSGAATSERELKAGHHRRKNSTTPEFPAGVQPGAGIITAEEDNPCGHPNPEPVSRLEEVGFCERTRRERSGFSPTVAT